MNKNSALVFVSIFSSFILLASPVSALVCGNDEVCLYSGDESTKMYERTVSGSGNAVATASSGAPVSVREIEALAGKMPSFYDATLRQGGWCQKFLENDKGKDSISVYETRAKLAQRSWEEILMQVSSETGVKPEYLCVLLKRESGGSPRTVGGDGECGAFQTMPQFYANYRDYCSKWGGEYGFVKETCSREKWGNLAFNAYPSADLPESLNDPKSCFHPYNSAMAGAIEFKEKLDADRCKGDVHCAFWGYNGYSDAGRKYADRAMVVLQKVYDSSVG